MSLINDALKKAARQRAEEQGEVIPPMPGGGHRRPLRPGEPMRVQTIVLIGAAALALIVVSAVVTGIFVTGKPDVKVAAVIQSPTLAPTPAPQKVVVQGPLIAVPQALPASVPTPTSAPVAVVRPAVVAAVAPTPGCDRPSYRSPEPERAHPGHRGQVQGFWRACRWGR